MLVRRILFPIAVPLPFLVPFACDTAAPPTSVPMSSCSEQPEPQCYACPDASPNIAVCEQSAWVCPPSNPCPSEDGSTDAAPETGPIGDASPDAETVSDGSAD